MALVSTRVAPGMKILADHFNKLWQDLTQNHDHSSGQGGAVDHADLAETGAMSGVSHTHGNIETHMNGSGGSFADSPGGAQGVHGLNAAAFVAGSLGSQFVIQGGNKSLSGKSQGNTVVVTFADDNGWGNGAAFAVAPTVLVTPVKPSPGEIDDIGLIVHAKDTTTFTIYIQGPQVPTSFDWIAIGTK